MTKEEFISKTIKVLDSYVDRKAKYYEMCEDEGIEPVKAKCVVYDEGKRLINEIADRCMFDEVWHESVMEQLALLQERISKTKKLHASFNKLYNDNKELNDFWDYVDNLCRVGKTAEMNKLAYTHHLNVYVRRNGVFLQSDWKGAFGLNVYRTVYYNEPKDDVSLWTKLIHGKMLRFIREVAEELHQEYFKRLDALTPMINELEKDYIGFTFMESGKMHTYTAGTLFDKWVAEYQLYGLKIELDTMTVIHGLIVSIL